MYALVGSVIGSIAFLFTFFVLEHVPVFGLDPGSSLAMIPNLFKNFLAVGFGSLTGSLVGISIQINKNQENLVEREPAKTKNLKETTSYEETIHEHNKRPSERFPSYKETKNMKPGHFLKDYGNKGKFNDEYNRDRI